MKILHLVSPGLGGIEAYIFSHYKYMDRKRFRFDFMTQNRGLQDAEEYREFPFDVKLLPVTSSKNPAVFTNRVREILEEGYDVLHLHTCFWTGFLIEEIAKEMGIRKVIVHSHSTFIDNTDPKKREQLLKRHEEVKRAFSPDLATDFWACSWKAADWLYGPQIPRERIRIMTNAIEIERFQFSPEKREQIRKKLDLGRELVFGTTGRLTYQKNHAFLIELLCKFRKSHGDAKLLIIGEGELRGDLERQIQENSLEDAVRLLGWKTNVEDYLQAMDIFLLPSRFEGLGIAIIEAAAAGLPCIVSDQVPEDVAFTERIQHMPLRLPDWNHALENLSGIQFDRYEGADIVRNAGYDIRRQAKVLEGLYET